MKHKLSRANKKKSKRKRKRRKQQKLNYVKDEGMELRGTHSIEQNTNEVHDCMQS